MEKKLEVGRLQGCEVGAGLRKTHWQSSFGDIKRAEPKGTRLGENFFPQCLQKGFGGGERLCLPRRDEKPKAMQWALA